MENDTNGKICTFHFFRREKLNFSVLNQLGLRFYIVVENL
jgi:hypothetical protein